VLRGIWLAYRRRVQGEPDNAHAKEWRLIMRAHRRSIVDRFAQIPSSLWKLKVDWSNPDTIRALHESLSVVPLQATRSQEKKNHATLAAALRKASNLLTSHTITDIPAATALTVMAKDFGMPATAARMPMVDASPREPTLSEFLRAMASLYEGEIAHVYGVHKSATSTWSTTKQIGANAAAAQAFENVTSLLRELTHKPHNELAASLVRCYHPGASDTDFARAANARNSTKMKNAE
jgi:hypothetical protein